MVLMMKNIPNLFNPQCLKQPFSYIWKILFGEIQGKQFFNADYKNN